MKKNQNKQNQNRGQRVKREQPRKDSSSKRVNCDNERVSKFDKNVKGYSRSKSSDFDEVSKVGKENDIAWYNKVTGMFNPAANISYLPITGAQQHLVGGSAVPGVFADYWQPTLGAPNGTAINQIKESLYSFVVHANSRNTSYDSNDLFMTIVAGANVFSYLATVIRAYGTMMQWQATNMNTPRMLITAMGFDYDDFKSNLPHMLFDINNMIAQSRQLWVPNEFPFVARWFWMNSNVYKDAESVKAQYYMHVQNVYWMYSETFMKTGTALIPVSPVKQAATGVSPTTVADFMDQQAVTFGSSAKSLLSWADAVAFFNRLLEPLLTSTYRGVMMGDILKAYGADKLYTIAEIEAGYAAIPVYHQEVLTQIENEMLYNLSPTGLLADLDNNVIAPFVTTTGSGGATTPGSPIEGRIVNFHHDHVPTPDELMIATRLRVGVLNNSKDITVYKTSSYDQFSPSSGLEPSGMNPTVIPEGVITGSEVITNAKMFAFQYVDNIAAGPLNGIRTGYPLGLNTFVMKYNFVDLFGIFTFNTSNKVELSTGALQSLTFTQMLWSAFDWAPWLYATISGNGNNAQIAWAWGDYDNYSDMPRASVGNMHMAALYSELSVPFMA